jgi:hypothetical protein
MLYQGKLQEVRLESRRGSLITPQAISLLESIVMTTHPSAAGISEPILFNLTTLYELV